MSNSDGFVRGELTLIFNGITVKILALADGQARVVAYRLDVTGEPEWDNHAKSFCLPPEEHKGAMTLEAQELAYLLGFWASHKTYPEYTK